MTHVIESFGFSEDACLEQLMATLLWKYALVPGKTYYPLPSYPPDVYLIFEINNLFYPISGATAQVKGRRVIKLTLDLTRVVAAHAATISRKPEEEEETSRDGLRYRRKT